MPIDINDLPLFAEARDEGLREGRDEGLREGRDEGLREGQRDAVRRVLTNRFGDHATTERVSEIPDGLLLDAIDRATTGTAEEFTAWLDELQH